MMMKQLRHVLAAFAGLVATYPAVAHPQVWVTVRAEIIYAPDGSMSGIRQAWTFDDMFSAFAIQGIRVPTREQLQPLARMNVESLRDSDYFTFARINGDLVRFGEPPQSYYFDLENQLLTLHFTLPFKEAVKAQDVEFQIYDPS